MLLGTREHGVSVTLCVLSGQSNRRWQERNCSAGTVIIPSLSSELPPSGAREELFTRMVIIPSLSSEPPP